jgi:hypothetical protein
MIIETRARGLAKVSPLNSNTSTAPQPDIQQCISHAAECVCWCCVAGCILQVQRLLDIDAATCGEVQVPHLGEAFLTTVHHINGSRAREADS